MWGGWSPPRSIRIVTIFGWSLGGFIAAMIVVIVGLLAGGPVGRFKIDRDPRRRLDRGGSEASHDPPPPQLAGHRRDRRQPRARHPARHPERRDAPLEEGRAPASSSSIGRSRPHSPTTVANYRAAADQARAADQANPQRVAAEQRSHQRKDYPMTLKHALPLLALMLSACASAPQAAADPGAGGSAPVPGLSAAAGGTAQAAGEDGLPRSDALTATEQAIQLDELIKWVDERAGANG